MLPAAGAPFTGVDPLVEPVEDSSAPRAVTGQQPVGGVLGENEHHVGRSVAIEGDVDAERRQRLGQDPGEAHAAPAGGRVRIETEGDAHGAVTAGERRG